MMILIGLIVFAISLFVNRKKAKREYKKALARAGLVAYLFFILAITCFERTSTGEHQAEWIPLWSWICVFTGQQTLWYLEEICLNILLFMPLGCLFSLNFKISALQSLFIGLALSAAIEITQYILCLGLFEWDDMIHNSLGCLIGAAVVNTIRKSRNADMEK